MGSSRSPDRTSGPFRGKGQAEAVSQDYQGEEEAGQGTVDGASGPEG